MTENQLATNIKKRLKEEQGIDVDKKVIKEILRIESDEIYMVIATCDSYKYSWGKVYGIEKPPMRISGKYAELKTVIDNYGYSSWKLGYPKVKWAPQTKVCNIKPPEEYFEQPSIRYTTAARNFRKQAGFPELPEFDGLTEKKIKAICKKADDLYMDSLPTYERMRKKADTKQAMISSQAHYDYWEKTGHIPMGTISSLWDGIKMDSVMYYLAESLYDGIPIVEEYEIVLNAIDLDDWKYNGRHKRLKEVAEDLKKEMEENGIEPLPHITKLFNAHANRGLKVKYMDEDDPWGLKDVPKGVALKNMRLERQKREIEEMIANEDAAQEELDNAQQWGEVEVIPVKESR